MTNHVHLIFRTSGSDSDPGELMRSLKTYTANQIPKLIEENPQESRREWLLWMMECAAQAKSNVKHRQFWRQDNKPIELWSEKVIAQKMNYIHNNPVLSGFVTEHWHWKYSSAIDYAGGKGLLPLSTL